MLRIVQFNQIQVSRSYISRVVLHEDERMYMVKIQVTGCFGFVIHTKEVDRGWLLSDLFSLVRCVLGIG